MMFPLADYINLKNSLFEKINGEIYEHNITKDEYNYLIEKSINKIVIILKQILNMFLRCLINITL